MKKQIQTKPINIEVSLQYICDNCQYDHWLFLREAKQPDYKIVCECGNVIIPAQVSDIEISYCPDKLAQSVLDTCIDNLCVYGYTNAEARCMIEQSFDNTKSNNAKKLIEYSLKYFGEKYV